MKCLSFEENTGHCPVRYGCVCVHVLAVQSTEEYPVLDADSVSVHQKRPLHIGKVVQTGQQTHYQTCMLSCALHGDVAACLGKAMCAHCGMCM